MPIEGIVGIDTREEERRREESRGEERRGARFGSAESF